MELTMPVTIDELSNMAEFGGGGERRASVTFLPEPERRAVFCPVISTDDHIVEPPHMWEGRFPSRYADAAPRVVDTDDGGQRWLWDGQLIANVGFNAVAGRPSSEYGFEPTRFDEMRRGAWDIDARLADMDINGVWASVCFPSFLPGFVGQRISLAPSDPDLGMAAMRAWNDWMLEEWCGRDPDRMVPLQLPWLRDPHVAAAEVRHNAARGFKAVSFSESPDKLGLPSIHTGYWDPFLAACEETETVVCLHVGSSSTSPSTTPDAPPEVIAVLFFAYGMYAAVDWLYSRIPVRFPRLKICMSEGGIGWVAALMDRLDHCFDYQMGYLHTWEGVAEAPAEVLARSFWWCALDDESSWATRHRIGVDHIVVESDYPHADSTWPDTQPLLRAHLAGMPDDEVRKVCHENAAALFRHPLPPGDLVREV
ncbi:MAG TPA: amidohydrolase family protein [Acidimicrobiia bacterium]